MGSDDFIDLDTDCESDNTSEDKGVDGLNFSLSDGDGKNTSQMKEGIPNGDNIEIFEGHDEREESSYKQKMDLEVGSVQRQPILQQGVELVEAVTMADNSCAVTLPKCTVNNGLIDESPISGVKRARMTYVDEQPSVHVVYRSLTRESKKKLMELMQQWSEWHAQCQSSSNESSKESMEYGEETYFPALHIGSEKSSTVSFWLDNQSRKEDILEYQLDKESVPLYDRGCTLGSTLPDGSANPERIKTLEASRCFNCGSYAHSLKECSKPRDNAAINNARKQHGSKRNQASGSRSTARYYLKSPGKFDDLKAGVLGPETRESLGIGEFDPPPWLHRMREMGYPPGYLDIVEDEDQPSGIEIFDDEEKVEFEDGELPEKGEVEPPERKMSVEFPGINAPIPENADHRRWAAAAVPAPGFSGSNSFKNRAHSRPSHLSEPQRGPYHDTRRATDHRDDGPPGVEYGPPSGYSPRYSPYNSNPATRSPNLGRSLSDRGWGSPLPYESNPAHSPHSPYPYTSSLPRQSPQYHGPAAGFEQWSHGSPYNGSASPYSASPDMPSQQHARDRHDHRHYHHHHHHRK